MTLLMMTTSMTITTFCPSKNLPKPQKSQDFGQFSKSETHSKVNFYDLLTTII